MKGTVWLAWALGACCAVLLALGLILFYANGFTTMMIFNRPETGFRFAFVDGLVAATFPGAGVRRGRLDARDRRALQHLEATRIQSFIDRGFYPRKYDAQKTLEDFGYRLRDEVDLDNLAGELAAVVEQTIRPAHVSLWLRDREVSTGMQEDR